MSTLKQSNKRAKRVLLSITFFYWLIFHSQFLVLVGGLLCFLFFSQEVLAQDTASEVEKVLEEDISPLLLVQGNSILPFRAEKQALPQQGNVIRRLNVIVTAYSSAPDETDDTPFVTASGAYVADGVVANNFLSFGTKIKLPEYFGERIFVVQDRMHPRKGYYHIDIWFPTKEEALNFGAKKTYIEILEGV